MVSSSLVPLETPQDCHLDVVDAGNLANSHPEGRLARRWCKGRSDASSTPSVCKRLMGDFTSLDLFLKVKPRENPSYRSAIAQTDIHQINSRKGELITASSH